MNVPCRLSQAWLWPLLALGAAGSGSACSAPAPPPEQTTPDASAQDTSAQAPAVPAPQTQAPQPPSASDAAAEGTGADPAADPDPAPSAQQPAQPPPIAPRPPAPPATDAGQAAEPATLTVTMLSRGKGVPDEARAAYQDARALLERRRDAGIVTEMGTQRIGLEGETRLCAEFRSVDAAQSALAEIRKRTAGIDLLDVEIAPCPPPKGKSP